MKTTPYYSFLSIVSPLLFLILFCCGCTSGSRDVVVFDNGFEAQKGWCEMNNVYEGKGHTGRFSSFTNSDYQYGTTFRIKIKDISDKPVTYLRFSVWCYADAIPVTGRIIMSIDKDTVKNVFWNTWELSNTIKEKQKWTEIDGELSLKTNDANVPENTLIFYVWSNDKTNVLADDFHLEFTTK